MRSNPISHLPHWQAARLAVLLDALDGMMISYSKHASLTWLAGFETHTYGEHHGSDHPRPADRTGAAVALRHTPFAKYEVHSPGRRFRGIGGG